ncbi:MAG: hypothetical protein J6023_03565 [Clostridia bacterium]|nr:hypothetical protein [Clostridia bacterium]
MKKKQIMDPLAEARRLEQEQAERERQKLIMEQNDVSVVYLDNNIENSFIGQMTGQKEPEDVASTVRCIIDSLALKYRETIEKIADVTGKKPSKIHVVGGGVQDRLLCQATADACGLPVVAGPVEATACGNILAQMLTFGEIASLEEARQVVRNSFDPAYYSPGANREQYQEAYDRFQKVTGKNI